MEATHFIEVWKTSEGEIKIEGIEEIQDEPYCTRQTYVVKGKTIAIFKIKLKTKQFS